MKKTVSILMLALLTTITTPALAANQKTFGQRADDIKDTYGLNVVYDEAGEAQAANQLTQIELALSCIGPEFTQKMAAHYSDNTFDGELQILITADETWEALGVGGTFSTLNNTIELYVRANSVIPAANIVHEFGHVYQWYLDPDEFDEYYDLSGGKDAYIKTIFDRSYDRDQFVNEFASTRASEDFAETFMFMVVNGGAKPAAAGRDTVLYQKFQWIRQSLVEHIGTDSSATERASGFLDGGLENE